MEGAQSGSAAVVRQQVGMSIVNVFDRRPFIEVPHRVAAEQFEIMAGAQLIPERLQPDRGGFAASLPEEIDHLSIRANGAMLPSVMEPGQ